MRSCLTSDVRVQLCSMMRIVGSVPRIVGYGHVLSAGMAMNLSAGMAMKISAETAMNFSLSGDMLLSHI